VIRRVLLALVVLLGSATDILAQNDRRAYAGLLIGISALSADGQSITNPPAVSVSLYAPENGPALNAFAGFHLAPYFSIQGNYMWNRNEVTLFSSFATEGSGGFYEQQRRSEQHAMVIDGLIYFRDLHSSFRPYLGTGLSVLRFRSDTVLRSVSSGLVAPAHEFASTTVALRSAVGIDIAISPHVSVRYSFSETISRNPISPRLTPPAERRLANFQNLVGLVGRF
jgi:hypothetical protein